MSGEDENRSPVLDLLAAGAARREDAFAPFWRDVIDADPRLAALRDSAGWQDEIEGRLLAWRDAADAPRWHGEFSRPEVEDIAKRARQIADDVAALLNDVRALGNVAAGGKLDETVAAMMLALIVVADEVGPVLDAADGLDDLPTKAGGRGQYTAGLRAKPADEFGEAVATIFRQAGLSLGGNVTRDPALEVFMKVAGRFAISGPIPGMASLLARLRR